METQNINPQEYSNATSDQATPAPKRRFILILLLLVIVLLGAGAYFGMPYIKNIVSPVQKTADDITKESYIQEGLKAGMTREEAEAFYAEKNTDLNKDRKPSIPARPQATPETLNSLPAMKDESTENMIIKSYLEQGLATGMTLEESVDFYNEHNDKKITLEEAKNLLGGQTVDAADAKASTTNQASGKEATPADTKRKADLNLLINAIYSYQMATSGGLPSCQFESVATAIPECDTDKSGMGSGNGGFEGAVQFGTDSYDCSSLFVPKFMSQIPINPSSQFNAQKTGYWVCQQSGGAGRIYLIAEQADNINTTTTAYDSDCEIPGTTVPAMCISG